MKQASLFDTVQVGSQVTCRPDGKVRGATVKEVYENGDILIDCWCARRKEFRIPAGKYQLSRLWNEPGTRKNI
ncbi:hypothetical protein [Halocella sp. SP3-1]|uniref:hypothetical protein n=1 Tax=Halocella sp. SP3-1 TaxID=2382161 RepID=UPI000F7519AB|nr:hypothetical protein [Halocella sp. SP3-1]AZO95262.1 hypothetical protein D7D81_12045 [Halocella sp. SP3-1]